ncbi:hypothetical protein ASO17_25665 [Salmonella enterica subsp. enterica serovar Infantis]|nr:hypothetical protein ASO17_25665 [Salmonella enterica subsp. enterica serovar Infantis]
MALVLCAVVLFKMKRPRYAWVALGPTARLLVFTPAGGWPEAVWSGGENRLLGTGERRVGEGG